MCLAQLVDYGEKLLRICDVLATIANFTQHIKILLLFGFHFLQYPNGFFLDYLADGDGNSDDVLLTKLKDLVPHDAGDADIKSAAV